MEWFSCTLVDDNYYAFNRTPPSTAIHTSITTLSPHWKTFARHWYINCIWHVITLYIHSLTIPEIVKILLKMTSRGNLLESIKAPYGHWRKWEIILGRGTALTPRQLSAFARCGIVSEPGHLGNLLYCRLTALLETAKLFIENYLPGY